jgi:protein-S-isoprenylcysteine O-methyltransferase Ste14
MNGLSPPDTARLPEGLLLRLLAVVYGGACYLIFLAIFFYAIGFIGNLVVPKSIDTGSRASPAETVTVDLLLLGLFAIPHSVMARPRFKRWWTRFVPLPVERSTYVLVSSLLLALLFWQWRPMPGVVWQVERPVAVAAVWVSFTVGWLVVLISTFLIDHFDLFGLRQVYLYAVGKPYSPPPFRTPGLYRFVRHPIMLGFVIAFWATPVMTWGHLIFAGMTTAYIIVGIHLEERDLRSAIGSTYEEYQKQVSMILPWIRKGVKP